MVGHARVNQVDKVTQSLQFQVNSWWSNIICILVKFIKPVINAKWAQFSSLFTDFVLDEMKNTTKPAPAANISDLIG